MPFKDPEKRKAYNAGYRAERQEELNARERERYYEPGCKERQQETRKANLARYAGYQRDYRFRYPRETLVNQARSRAKKFGLPCDLTVEGLHWPTHCPILGLELDYNKTNPGERTIRHSVPTLDRKTNKLGYVLGNVFVISHRANRIKSDATIEELEAVLAYMRP